MEFLSEHKQGVAVGLLVMVWFIVAGLYQPFTHLDFAGLRLEQILLQGFLVGFMALPSVLWLGAGAVFVALGSFI